MKVMNKKKNMKQKNATGNTKSIVLKNLSISSLLSRGP